MCDSTPKATSLTLPSTDSRRRPIVSENFAEYRSWKAMRNRCANPKSHNYAIYGARGIQVCERWNEFENFLADMGKRPTPQHTLDRIDTNGDYCPENCRWAEPRVQANNRRTNKILEYNGRSQTLTEWANELGLSVATLGWRIANNWTVESALSTPVMPSGSFGKKRVGERYE